MFQECDIQDVYLTKQPINESQNSKQVVGVPLSLVLLPAALMLCTLEH